MEKYYYFINGAIVSFDFKLDENYALGESLNDHDVFVELSPEQVTFLNSHPKATVYEVWNMETQQPYTPTVEDIRLQKIAELHKYNESDEVNSFTFMGRKMWVSLRERIAFRQAVEAKIALGIETIILPIEGLMSTSLPCATVKNMLDRLEVYASDADTRIKYHEAAIGSLQDETEINNYNYKEGMPDLLNFDNL